MYRPIYPPSALPAPFQRTPGAPIAAEPPSKPRLSAPGIALSLCALLMAASAFRSLRIEVGGLLVHPVNIAASILFVAMLPALKRLPRSILIGMGVFAVTWTLACLQHERAMFFTVKLAASLVLTLVAAVAVRSERDFRLGALALALAGTIIASRGLIGLDAAGAEGINPLQGIANKNGFSLYALPPLLLSVYLALLPDVGKLNRTLFAAASILLVLALFSTGNRSGWIGAIAIAVLISVRAASSLKKLIMLLAMIALAVSAVMSWGDTLVIEERLQKTKVDVGARRWQLFNAAVEVGLEKPILGSSPQRLTLEMARRKGVRRGQLDPHNAFGLVFGGAGALGLGTLLLCGYVIWRKPRSLRAGSREAKEAHFLLRAMLVLWILRGQFSSEIFFSPSFGIALGLCIGLCITRGVWQPQSEPEPRRQNQSGFIRA